MYVSDVVSLRYIKKVLYVQILVPTYFFVIEIYIIPQAEIIKIFFKYLV